jgi:maltodextrin utilization protein YvdJ
MFKIFRKSFRFRDIFSLKDESLGKFILYFLMMILVASFPLNYQIFRSDGFDGLTRFTQYLRNHLELEFIDSLPSGGSLSPNGFSVFPDKEYRYLTETEQGEFILVLNPKEEGELRNAILLYKDRTVYYDSDGNHIVGSYGRLDKGLDFGDLKSMDRVEARDLFFSAIDSTFNKYGVFYSLAVNTGLQYLMNALLVLVLSLLMLLVKINYERITGFSENLKIVIASMTIPSILSFVAALLHYEALNTFFVVIFQFLTPIIAVLTLYKGSKKPQKKIL